VIHFYGEEKHLKKSMGNYAQIRISEGFCKFIKPYKCKMGFSEGQPEHFLKPGKSPCELSEHSAMLSACFLAMQMLAALFSEALSL